MRRITFFLTMMLFATVAAVAQNYMLVDSEKVFKSIDGYNTALESLDKLAEQYQEQVDAKYQTIEKHYQIYVARKSSLTESSRKSYEEGILKLEAEAIEYQESLFGDEGELMKRRVELINPIQQRVFDAIESYALANGFDLVMDTSSNPTLLYKSQKIDRSDAIINMLKSQN